MQNKHLLNHVKPGGRTFSVLVTLLVTAMTLLPQSVWGQTDYGLTVGGVVVTSENAESITGDNIQGSVSFDVQTSALTLEGATITGNIVVNNLASLTINVVGKNTINAGASSALQSNVATTSCALTFQRGSDLDCSLALNSEGVTVISTGFSTPGYQALGLVVDGVDDNYNPDYYTQYGLVYYAGNDNYEPITSATITSYTTYDIIVNGEAVTNLNKNKIRKSDVGVGHITFDGEHTLTLNNVPNVVFDGQYPFIQTSMDLTINLIGENFFDTGSSIFIETMAGDNNTHTLTFTTSADAPGKMILQNACSFNGFERAYQNGLAWCPPGYYSSQNQNDPKIWVAQPFDLVVAGVAVTTDNAADILVSLGQDYTGMASFNASTNTLTLTNFNYDGVTNITSNLATLNVNLVGENMIPNKTEAILSLNSDAVLTFKTSSDNPGYLFVSEGGTAANGFAAINYENGLCLNVNDDGTSVGPLNTPSIMLVESNLIEIYSDNNNAQIVYSVTYADESLSENNVTNQEYLEEIELLGPATITAKAVVGDVESDVVTGKLFGFAKSEVNIVKGETVEVPAIIPAIAEIDGIAVSRSSDDEDYVSISDGMMTGKRYGSTTIYGNLMPGNDPLSYDILNSDGYVDGVTVNVVPPAPTLSLEEGEYRGNQTLEISTTLTEEDVEIKYQLGENAEATSTYAAPIVLDETTTVVAWVVAHDESGAPFNSERVTATYTITQPESYGITVNGIAVHEDNRTNVMGDQGEPTVQFDGVHTLFLNNANISGEIIVNSSAFVEEPLTIYLKGTNTINNRTYLVQNALATANIKVKFDTGELAPGSLTYTTQMSLKEPISAFVGCSVTYVKGLAPALSEGANSGSVLSISMSLQPIVNHSGEEKTLDGEGDGLGEDIETKTTDELTAGVTVNGILYTLPDADDGYESTEESGSGKVVAINSLMTVEEGNVIAGQVADGTVAPGTAVYAAAFRGMTLLLPAGAGNMKFDVRTNESGVLAVKIGNLPAVTFDNAKDAFEELVVPFACSVPTYVQLFNQRAATGSRELDSHRAPGRKETATVEIKGLSVSASSVVAVPEPALSPVMLDKSAVAKEAGKHFIKVADVNVTGVNADAFEDVMEDKELTYVDLTNTGIKGITVDRSTDAFKNVPAQAFIYLPAGNKVKTGTKNVIIGSVCEDMEMADDAQYFEMAQDFTALQVKQNRDYSKFVGKNCTVYLPFAIDAETAASLGTFYELKGYDSKTKIVSMESVTETKANTPYMFKPKAADTKVAAKMVTVEATPAAAPVVGSIKFVGTYEQKDIVSNTSTQYYCFMADGVEAGKFVHVTTNAVTMNPYRAYMVVEGAASRELDLVIDGVSTGIKNMKVGTDDNVYYDLQGRRVLYPTKGLYIVNGRKVIIK
ncbi:MAG: hypothetical protein IJV09_05255 [Prevotella sp.]|nr:hypothetical protein [Prevotella sp.]